MKSIINAASALVNLGVKDESVRPYTRIPKEYPQHCPKFLIYAKKGPSILDPLPEQLLVGNERDNMYGTETFSEGSKYFNHQTLFANGVNAEGNQAMYVRLLGRNHGPKPSIRLFLDVLKTKVDLYERNPDGSIKTTLTGDLIVKGTADNCYRAKWVVDYARTDADKANFGMLDITQGDQVDPVTGALSERYPVLELEHSFYGEDGNLAGIRLWGQNTENTAYLPTKLVNRERTFPLNFAVVRKNSETGNVKFQETLFLSPFITVTLKPKAKDPLTNQRVHISERILNEYQNLSDPRYPIKFGEFGRSAVYQENIDTLLEMFHAAEIPFLDSNADFTADPSEKYMFNFVTGTNTNNVPYHSFIFVDSVDSVRFSPSTNVFARGGDDGDMSLQSFAEDAAEYMERYGNPDDELMDDAYHIESHFYDSGFPLEQKYRMIKFISERKDTFIHLCPFEAGERRLTRDEEYSITAALISRIRMYPESTHWNTPAYRALIQGVTARVRDSDYTDNVPVLYQIAVKSARYMGAGNGRFKAGYNFEGYPGHVLDNMYDVSINWVPDSLRIRYWDRSLNWVGRLNREEFYFPAFKTVSPDDTSVLTSYITSCIFCYGNKILSKCQKYFTGRSDLTMAQFNLEVNNWLSLEFANRFDNRVVVVPKCHFTSMDQIRNYSWTVPVEIGAPGMKTVMTGYLVARRIEDMISENN